MKTVIVLNEKLARDAAVLLNATGHIAQALGRQLAGHPHARFALYEDAGGTTFPEISWWPLVVLEGKAQKMWALFDECADTMPRALFLDTMIAGGSEEQIARTKQARRDGLVPVAVGVFGSAEALAPLTKRFSLWRPRAPEDRAQP